ncbi:metallophosphoesterase [Tistrella mobilis]|uniref:Metallophosphoesterase n=1 Tax=Tistrella mobilis (strain KA081020-065) TaxID=1110502 RepID=I3TMV4_TISMK|nr:metallophosphoesterase [Tistrella mobilis]AFK54092.1 Metallophosphoesterase [Tistrella mobilis KA081020-065]
MTDIRLALLSDLHLDVRRRRLERAGLEPEAALAAIDDLGRRTADAARDAGADLVILAGDIANGTGGIDWAGRNFGDLPVLYIPGNHEFYGHDRAPLIREMRRAATAAGNLRVLDGDAIDIDARDRRVRILGGTAWTDYRLYGDEAAATAMDLAGQVLYDHQRIREGDRPFSPEDARGLHLDFRAWLAQELAASDPSATVVVTHHGPAAASVAERFEGSPLSPAFVSDMTDLMQAHEPALWLHGHTHHDVDYRVGRTRVVARQWGYPEEGLSEGFALLTI